MNTKENQGKRVFVPKEKMEEKENQANRFFVYFEKLHESVVFLTNKKYDMIEKNKHAKNDEVTKIVEKHAKIVEKSKKAAKRALALSDKFCDIGVYGFRDDLGGHRHIADDFKFLANMLDRIKPRY